MRQKSKIITPRTPNQKRLIQTLNEKSFTLVNGMFGTGKNFCVQGWACEQLLAGNFNKIIMSRAVGHLNQVAGYMPGGMTEKMAYYFAQQEEYFKEFLTSQQFEKMQRDRVIEILPIGILRGRSFNNCIVILDECQNSSKDELILLLTRMGRGTKMVWMGDELQADLDTTSFFEKLFHNIEDDDIGKIMLTEEDCLRHKNLYRWYKKIRDID